MVIENRKKIVLFSLSTLLLWLFSSLVYAANIQVRTDRNPVGLNESFQLVYESEGDIDGDPDFSPLDRYLDILNRGQSSNISIINGSYSSKKNWTLTAMARQEGKIELPPISFGSDKSPSYTLTVNKAAQDTATDDFFTRVRVSKSKLYVQQQLVVTQQLFSAYNLAAYSLGELKFGGLDVVVEPLAEEKQYRTRLNGQAYVVVEKRYAVFAQQSGVLKLEPVLAEGQTGSRSKSLFDQFSRGKIVRARSGNIDIEVMDIPADADMSPWLPAASLELLEQWAQANPKFVQGEPLTRTVSIKAEGLSAAQLPVLPDKAIDGFKQYPDQPLLENIRNDNGLSGYRVEKIAFIPTRSGQITLPAIEIPWWNIATKKREVARIPQRVVEVIPAANTPAQTPPAIATSPTPTVVTPVVPAPAPEPSAMPQTVSEQRWMWLAVVALLGWLATAVAWIIFTQRKHVSIPDASRPDAMQERAAFKQLLSSCAGSDASACRANILAWAKLYFSQQSILSLGDLRELLPEEVMQQLTNLDAVLYGSRDVSVDFTVIASQLQQFVKTHKQHSSIKPDLLQPLYK